MTRQQRRLIERRITKVIERDGDRCSICRTGFKHNARTHGGLDAKGATVVVGDCCKSHLMCQLSEGIYTKNDYDFFDRGGDRDGGPKRQLSSELISEALDIYQKLISEADQMNASTRKRAGYTDNQPAIISVLDHPWKEDDRLWFEQRPDRSHRVREPYADELPTGMAVPDGYIEILIVRQVEPGQRVKQSYFLNQKLMPVPDDEAIAHSLFEVACGRVGTEWSDLRAAVERYEAAAAVVH